MFWQLPCSPAEPAQTVEELEVDQLQAEVSRQPLLAAARLRGRPAADYGEANEIMN